MTFSIIYEKSVNFREPQCVLTAKTPITRVKHNEMFVNVFSDFLLH